MFDVLERINAFEKLGRFLAQTDEARNDDDLAKLNQYFLEEYHRTITAAGVYNNWFTIDNTKYALQAWSRSLTKENIDKWVSQYDESHFTNDASKTIAIVMAGNIPLVGLHDFITVLLTGHKVIAKPSSDDTKLIPFVAQLLVAIDQRFADRIRFADSKLTDFDAVIATGSNNSARYFEHYFGKYPHIIRKNRTSVAILDGKESVESLKKLGADIFQYFGLGCRNVSKLYLPEGYNTDTLFEAFYDFKEVINNGKYGNNYDYNRAIYLLEKQAFLENGFLILKENESLHAPAAVVHYQYYSNLETLEENLKSKEEELQCIVSEKGTGLDTLPMGTTQEPQLWNYADKVDTVKFLRAV